MNAGIAGFAVPALCQWQDKLKAGKLSESDGLEDSREAEENSKQNS
jgi:hypothetical protein